MEICLVGIVRSALSAFAFRPEAGLEVYENIIEHLSDVFPQSGGKPNTDPVRGLITIDTLRDIETAFQAIPGGLRGTLSACPYPYIDLGSKILCFDGRQRVEEAARNNTTSCAVKLYCVGEGQGPRKYHNGDRKYANNVH